MVIGKCTFSRLNGSVDSELRHRVKDNNTSITVISVGYDRLAIKYEDCNRVKCHEGEADEIVEKYNKYMYNFIDRLHAERNEASFSEDFGL